MQLVLPELSTSRFLFDELRFASHSGRPKPRGLLTSQLRLVGCETSTRKIDNMVRRQKEPLHRAGVLSKRQEAKEGSSLSILSSSNSGSIAVGSWAVQTSGTNDRQDISTSPFANPGAAPDTGEMDQYVEKPSLNRSEDIALPNS